MQLTAQTFTNITGLTSGALSTSTTYAFDAVIGLQVTGTQGVQFAVQCSVAGGTLEAQCKGNQTSTAIMAHRLSAQGTQGPVTGRISGDNVIRISGILVTPGSGSPTIGIQAKGAQASQTPYIRANSYLRVEKTS
jgi:hypothetical protein